MGRIVTGLGDETALSLQGEKGPVQLVGGEGRQQSRNSYGRSIVAPSPRKGVRTQ